MIITRENLINIVTDAYIKAYPSFKVELLHKCVERLLKDFDIEFLNKINNPEDVLNQIVDDFKLAVLEAYQELLLNQVNVYQLNSWFY
ncbi:hypothetical protein [Turicibacter sanguinis]|jgi:hypothetical protein|uniref:hypothetical protein n=1 Tax=Turicibacter sanguinis TaxID=154288 RepID=UPI00325B0E81